MESGVCVRALRFLSTSRLWLIRRGHGGKSRIDCIARLRAHFFDREKSNHSDIDFSCALPKTGDRNKILNVLVN
jgi:hypothetical protein